MAERFGELAVVGARLAEPLTGVGRYLEKLLENWAQVDHPFERIVVYAPGKTRLSATALAGRNAERVIPQRISPLYWEQVQLWTALRGADIIFAPYSLPLLTASRGVVSNLGIYEGRPGDFPWMARMRTMPLYRTSARRAAAVLANSSSTRNDVARHFGLPLERIEVVLMGADESLAPAAQAEQPLPDEVRRRYGLPEKPFFLFVGKLSKRRNIPLLVEAFARAIREAELPHHLVIAGPDAWGIDPLGQAERFGCRKRVNWIEHLPVSDLGHFYRAARAFVLPTEHEGFSLTIVEAMACGTPAIVFKHPGLEPAVEHAAQIAEASNLAQIMTAVARNDALAGRLREKGLECSARYRWSDAAAQTMSVISRVAFAAKR